MDNAQNQAITAIRDIALENMVAESLHRVGWELIYRATSNEELERVLRSHPEAILIGAEDFLSRTARYERRIIWVTKTTGEHELHSDLRNLTQNSAQHPTSIPPIATKVSVITTVESGIGGSTVAINLAYESAQSGSKTLLLDFNTPNPFLSRFFEIQRINRTIAPTSFGFAIGEISDFSLCAVVAQEANLFDHVIIDLGRTPVAKEVISGQRLHESLVRWSLESVDNLYLLARGEEPSILQMKEKIKELKTLAVSDLMTSVFIAQSPQSTRERRHFLDSARSCLSGGLYLLTRDVRNLSRARIERVPVAAIAPKSVLAHEISQLHRQALERER